MADKIPVTPRPAPLMGLIDRYAETVRDASDPRKSLDLRLANQDLSIQLRGLIRLRLAQLREK
jgi:hypothetical protein